jgi:hypothetical protein
VAGINSGAAPMGCCAPQQAQQSMGCCAPPPPPTQAGCCAGMQPSGGPAATGFSSAATPSASAGGPNSEAQSRFLAIASQLIEQIDSDADGELSISSETPAELRPEAQRADDAGDRNAKVNVNELARAVAAFQALAGSSSGPSQPPTTL